MEKVKLKTKFGVLLVAIFVVTLVFNIAWTSYSQRSQMENELREKGKVLSQQMSAVWDFMSSNQDRFDSEPFSVTGSYQGLHCAVAGRSIANLFSAESGYETRFVNFNPRNIDDTPDDVESIALKYFYDNPSAVDYFDVIQTDEGKVFRYLSPMKIQSSCLECHGSPKGALDITGHPKEGLEIGDIAGATSIAIPMDIYIRAEQQTVASNILLFISVMLACLFIVYFGLTKLVTRPLQSVSEGASRIKEGDYSTDVSADNLSYELNILVDGFNEMAHELEHVYAGLESDISERTASLENANKALSLKRAQLEKANELLKNENEYKSSFLATMSHELRTPLTSIIAFSEMLMKDMDSLSDHEKEIYKEINSNSRVLLLMVNDILEISRLDAGKSQLSIEAVDLGDVAGLVQSIVEPLARQNGVSFNVIISPETPLINADFEKVRHIIENLCGNAVKFTPEGGSVQLIINGSSADSFVEICVVDTGIGIDQKDQEWIFERFAQADSSVSRKYNGTGLGLALAKEYTEIHGGTISVESELGKGSTFIVRLPV